MQSLRDENEVTFSFAAGSPTEEDFCKTTSKGILDTHAYVILGVAEAPIKDSYKTVRLIKLRNPWGNGQSQRKMPSPSDCEWTGAYSDDSPEMTDRLLEFLEHKRNNHDGVRYERQSSD